MARADLIVRLVRSANRGDQPLFRKAVEALIAEERAKQHHVFANRLQDSLQSNGAKANGNRQLGLPSHQQVIEITPERSFDDLVLPSAVEQAVREVVEEQHRGDLLRSYNLEPRHRILLAGSPGNGKTSLAEALAHDLMVPLFVVRYEAVVASYLGETSSRLNRLFDFARTRHCVLFFDEFDTLGKERGDEHETGEIKRVVSTLLLQIDRLPSHVVIVAASNHPELLDRAAWRRFQLRLHLPVPGVKEIEHWLRRAMERSGIELGRRSPKSLAKELVGASFAEIEELFLNIQRRWALAAPESKSDAIVQDQLKQWRARYSPHDEREEQSSSGRPG